MSGLAIPSFGEYKEPGRSHPRRSCSHTLHSSHKHSSHSFSIKNKARPVNICPFPHPTLVFVPSPDSHCALASLPRPPLILRRLEERATRISHTQSHHQYSSFQHEVRRHYRPPRPRCHRGRSIRLRRRCRQSAFLRRKLPSLPVQSKQYSSQLTRPTETLHQLRRRERRLRAHGLRLPMQAGQRVCDPGRCAELRAQGLRR